MQRRRTVIALGAALLGLLTACSSPDVGEVSAPGPTQEIVFEGATAIPSSTTRDWVTYGDFAVQWTALSETRLPATAEEISHGEGTIGRQITVRVDKVVWARPGGRRARACRRR